MPHDALYTQPLRETGAGSVRSRIRKAARQLEPTIPGIVSIHFREEMDWHEPGLRVRVEQIVHEACARIPSLAPNMVMLSSAPPLLLGGEIVDTGAPTYFVPFDSARAPMPAQILESLRVPVPPSEILPEPPAP